MRDLQYAQKAVQLRTVFHTLSHGRPMVAYEQQRELNEENGLPNLAAVPRRTPGPGRPINTPQPVTLAQFLLLVSDIETRSTAAAEELIADILRRFPDVPLLSSLAIIYPQYWISDDTACFTEKLAILQEYYGHARRTSDDTECAALIDAKLLEDQAEAFSQHAKECAAKVTVTETGGEAVTAFWRLMSSTPYWRESISEFEKLAEIAMVMVGGSVQDERAFSHMNYLKNKLRNRLNAHLELCMRLYAQPFYTLQNFPFPAAFDHWNPDRRYGLL